MFMEGKSTSVHGREYPQNKVDDASVHRVESDSKIKHVHTS